MIGSNLLDNLDDKNTNDSSTSNTPSDVNSIPNDVVANTPGTSENININLSDTVMDTSVKASVSDTSEVSTPDLSSTTIPNEMPSDLTIESFGGISSANDVPMATPPSLNESLDVAAKGDAPTTQQFPGSKSTYNKTPYDSYVSSSTGSMNKKGMEEEPIIKVGYSLPFNMDTAKLKSFALNFIVPIVGFSVSLILILTVVIPSFTTIPDLRTELSQKQSLNSTLSKKLSDLERLLDFKKIVDDNSTLINNVLVSEEMVPELLSQVDTIARESGLEVTRLSYSISQASGGSLGYPSVDVSLGVLGTYDQLANFFKLTESASRLIDVSGYRYAVGSKDANTLNMNLVLRSPYLFVNSEAVTDDPIDLDVTNQAFLNFVSKIQSLKYYNPNELPVIENIQETQPEEDLNQEAAIPSAE